MVVVSSSFTAPADGILLQSPATKLLVNDQEIGTATLYITENNVVWGGGVGVNGGQSQTVTLLYPTISLHAVQRDPSPALYMVLNYELRVPGMSSPTESGGGDANEEDEDFDADDQPITQLRFIPQSEEDLQPMYSAMNQGQSLHPDPTDAIDEDDEDAYMDGDQFDDAEEEFEDAQESGAVPVAARMQQLRLNRDNGAHNDESEDAEIDEQ